MNEQVELDTAKSQLEFLKSVFFQWGWIAIPMGMLFGFLTAATLFNVTPLSFEANSVLRVRNQTPYIAFPQRNAGRDPFVSTQLGLLRTRQVLEPALEKLREDFQELPGGADQLGWIKKKLKTRVNAELVHLTLADENPELARASIDAILNSYLNVSESQESEADDRVVQLLLREKEIREKSLNEAKEKIRLEVKGAGTMLGGEVSENLAQGSFTAMERRLINTEVELEVLKAKLTSEQNRIASGEAETIAERELVLSIQSNPEIVAIKEVLSTQTERLESYIATVRDPDRSTLVTKARRRVQELTDDLKSKTSKLVSEARAGYLEVAKAAERSRLSDLDGEVAAKQSVRDRLFESLQQQKAKLSNEVIDVEFARADLQRQEEIYNKISARIVALQTERAAPDRVEVVDWPKLPTEPEPRSWKKLLVAAAAGLLFPFALCCLYERLTGRIGTAQEVASQSGLEVIGETALLPRNVEKTPYNSERLRPFQDSVSCVASILQISNDRDKCSVVSVLSSISGEGKTCFSIQLAISLAQSSKAPVLIVETDFRAPDFDRLFRLEKSPGLADVVLDEMSLESVIQKNVVPDVSGRLDVISVGPSPHRILPFNTKALEPLIDRLRKSDYEFIVIDTSPLLSTNESLSVATISDINLLCAMKGRSRNHQIRSSIDRLAQIGVSPDGIVLNGVDHISYYSYYGRYQLQEA